MYHAVKRVCDVEITYSVQLQDEIVAGNTHVMHWFDGKYRLVKIMWSDETSVSVRTFVPVHDGGKESGEVVKTLKK